MVGVEQEVEAGDLDDGDGADGAGGRPAWATAGWVAGGAAVLVVGLLLGLGVADLTGGSGPEPEVAATAPVAAPGRVATVPDTTAPLPTAAPETTTTTTAPTSSAPEPSSTAPTTTTRPASTAPPSTAAPATTPPSTLVTTTTTPPAIQVTWSQDASGSLVVPEEAAATVLLTNTGGSDGQFQLRTSAGFSVTPTSGFVLAGQNVLVSVTRTSRGPAAGTITASVAPSNQYVIPLTAP